MYTVTMKNAILPGLEINGDYFVAAVELDAGLFNKENLAQVTVTDEEMKEVQVLTDAVLVDFRIVKEHTLFAIREKTERQKYHERLSALERASLEQDFALMELAAMLTGGV